MFIQKVYAHNIRSLTGEVRLDFTQDNNFVRIGGRNGRGKSTIMAIGLKILLGLTPAKPHLSKGHTFGYYIVKNNAGTFGVELYSKGNPKYYYILNNGEENSSRDTVNHNKCLPVIRANVGFDLDEENTGALNINENTKLNFVSTNGRTDLAYLKNLIYSEEIETLQTNTNDRIKHSKVILERNSNNIATLLEDRSVIKTVDQHYVNELQNYSDTIDIQNQMSNTLIQGYKDLIISKTLEDGMRSTVALKSIESLVYCITMQSETKQKIKLREAFIKGTNLNKIIDNIQKSSLKIEYTKQKIVQYSLNETVNELNEIKKNLIRNLEYKLNKLQVDGSLAPIIKEYIHIGIKGKLNEIQTRDTIAGIKEYVHISIKGKLNEIQTKDTTPIIKEYIYTGMLQNKHKLIKCSSVYSNLLSNIKKRESISTSFELDLLYNSRVNLEMILDFLNYGLKEKTIMPILTYSSLKESISRYCQIKEDIQGLEHELKSCMYKDGRCIVCLKEQ